MKKTILCLSLISLLLLVFLTGCKSNQNNSSSDVASGSVSDSSITEEEKKELENEWQQMISGDNFIIETPGNDNLDSSNKTSSNTSTDQSNVSSTISTSSNSTSTSTATSIATSSEAISSSTSSTTSIDPESNESYWDPWVPIKLS